MKAKNVTTSVSNLFSIFCHTLTVPFLSPGKSKQF